MVNASYKTENYEMHFEGGDVTFLGVALILGTTYVVGKALDAKARCQTACLETENLQYLTQQERKKS